MEKTESYNINFTVAPFETDKRRFFDENADGLGIGGCEMILVYDFEKFIRASLKAKSSYAKLCDGVMTVLIHGKYGDEKLKIEVKNNEVKVEKFDGEAEFEMDHHKATRVFFSNLEADRAELPANIQQCSTYFFHPLTQCKGDI